MARKNIIFRADGNSKTGLGHLYRIFALIEMFKTDFKYQLLVKDSSVLDIIPKDYNLNVISGEIEISEEPQWLSENYNPTDSIIIADGYQFNSAYQKDIKDAGFKLVYIDDLASEYMYADVVINHSPHIKKSDYISEDYTQFALGTKFAILRPLFLEIAKENRVIKNIETAFICFGGADFNNLTLAAVRGVKEIESITKIFVVVGSAYSEERLIKLMNERDGERVIITKNLNENQMMKIMKKSQIAIVPTSSISYEVCSVKSLIFGGYYVDNQYLIYKSFIEDGIIYDAGDFNDLDSKDYFEMVTNIINGSNEHHNEFLNKQKSLIDGQSKYRITNLINSIK